MVLDRAPTLLWNRDLIPQNLLTLGGYFPSQSVAILRFRTPSPRSDYGKRVMPESELRQRINAGRNLAFCVATSSLSKRSFVISPPVLLNSPRL